jgi:hypothetical protein
MLYRNEAIDLLTEGYESVAQMSIELAHKLGYTTDDNYAIVIAFGDPSSAGLPYFADVTCIGSQFQYSSYDAKTVITVNADFQVLVYHKPDILDYPVAQQIEMLEAFANQFAEGSLMRRFLTDGLMQWLRDNADSPDIHARLCNMQEVAHRLDENLTAMDVLFKDDFPF